MCLEVCRGIGFRALVMASLGSSESCWTRRFKSWGSGSGVGGLGGS